MPLMTAQVPRSKCEIIIIFKSEVRNDVSQQRARPGFYGIITTHTHTQRSITCFGDTDLINKYQLYIYKCICELYTFTLAINVWLMMFRMR